MRDELKAEYATMPEEQVRQLERRRARISVDSRYVPMNSLISLETFDEL